MNNYVISNSASAGRDLITNDSKTSYPIGQAWVFKVKNSQLNTLAQAFGKLVKTYKFDGSIGM